ncbi:DEAD/DEAH box helicase [Desulfurispira natronophila]|uniref:DEAD/DEAH box helicase n=1 Tax=Desulfurispira natronophila TaxID=682562 RepID=UPI00161890B7|nr:DEAD/DEAH box helicase [Desulfurispira natronophila]
MLFSDLGLSASILRAVTTEGYTQPTAVQSQAIPTVLKRQDVLAGAQTGTGKTAAFTLPMLEILQQSSVRGRRPVRGLVLTPTRELAAQVEESVRTYGKHLPLKSTVIYGGVGMTPQINALRRGVDIVVATPGRLLDHVQQKTLDLSQVEMLVLDEADRMLDMGFIHDIRKILALLPRQRQNLLFSATFSSEIKTLADTFLKDPVHIEVARRNTAAESVAQTVYPVDRERKRELLSQLIKTGDWQQVLVFTRTKHGANRLSQQLERDGISATAIHGNKSQSARTKALADFKKGKVRVLAATDIAARGLDIDELPHVVNFELPNVAEDYVHRIGRTGRAGNSGKAYSLVCIDEKGLLQGIERLLKREIPSEMVEGFRPDPAIAPEPIPNGRNGNRQSQQRGRHSGQPIKKARTPGTPGVARPRRTAQQPATSTPIITRRTRSSSTGSSNPTRQPRVLDFRTS